MILRHLRNSLLSLAAAMSLTGCIMEDFPECPNEYRLRLVFDRNMLGADAFASQVKSVDIKVFDPASGRMVYSYAEQGDALAADGYRVDLPVPPGTYDILCWGSMAEGESFGYANPSAAILEEHNVILNTEEGISRSRLNNLFHGLATGVTFTDNNDSGSRDVQTATIRLTKNTNRINVMLHNLDGTELHESDFSFRITSKNAEMAHDNSLRAQLKVEYLPWHITPIISETETSPLSRTSRAPVQSAIAAEFSTGRLSESADSRLEVYRETDGERIISVPLERNLLLFKGEFHSYMTDQEYLDRQDDYTITFILDKNNNWNRAAMIYINDWATPPVQYQEW